jgi:hypothetical protein
MPELCLAMKTVGVVYGYIYYLFIFEILSGLIDEAGESYIIPSVFMNEATSRR